MKRSAPFGFSRVVFLSHVLAGSAPVFPGDPPVLVEPAATIDADGYFLHRVTFGEQSGTHWAAPAHVSPGEATADRLDAADFILPAVVLDGRAQAAANPDYAVSVTDVLRWETSFGRVPEHAAVLLWSGYDERWNDAAAYLGTDSLGGLHYPGFSSQAARWLVDERRIGALGSDTMGIDPGTDATFGTNAIVLHGHRIHLENLRGLGELPASGGWIIVGGIRVAGGSGSPATVLGLVP